jgi:hypothetical protein
MEWSIMTITLTPDLERNLIEQARRDGLPPEEIAIRALKEKFTVPAEPTMSAEEWIRLVRGIARPRGVSLPDEAFSREDLYD